MLSREASLGEIQFRRAQDVKKYNKKVLETSYKHKLQQIAFEDKINQKRLDSLKEYLDRLKISKLILQEQDRQQAMINDNHLRELNII